MGPSSSSSRKKRIIMEEEERKWKDDFGFNCDSVFSLVARYCILDCN